MLRVCKVNTIIFAAETFSQNILYTNLPNSTFKIFFFAYLQRYYFIR